MMVENMTSSLLLSDEKRGLRITLIEPSDSDANDDRREETESN